MLYCSRELLWEETARHVSEMMMHLLYSEYKQRFMTEEVRSALKAYRCLVELEEKPL